MISSELAECVVLVKMSIRCVIFVFSFLLLCPDSFASN
jgi:hypothetical protein